MMAARHGRWLVFAAALALAATGCGETDTIRVHDETVPARAAVPPIPDGLKQYRTLAAMVPVEMDANEANQSGPKWWFFKASGPAATIAKYEADFDKLLGTVYASDDENHPITWDLPAGWTQGGSEKREIVDIFATLKPPGGEIEFTVTKSGASVLANAQRWWGQLWGNDKMQEFTVAMMPEYVRQLNVKGRLILRVDMSGPNDPKRRPMMKNPHAGGM